MIYGVRAVTKQFGDGQHKTVALRNLTLDIGVGEQIALLGPSGSGKTTLFRLLNASLFPTFGQILYRQKDVAAMNSTELRAMRRKIGSVYQQHCLVTNLSALTNTLSGSLGRWGTTRTVLNLVWPQRSEIDRAERCLEAVGLGDKRNFRCDQLSGGQQQRLAIARTLMQDPEVILADEPVASLDPALSDDILSLLVRLAEEGKLTLLTSLHQVALARRYAKRIVALRDGEIAFDSPAQQVTAKSLEELYDSRRPAHERLK